MQKQSLNESWEVVVIDDGGEQDLTHLTEEFRESLSLTIVKQDNAGPASARNKGIQIAKGKYIAFLDDDCEPRTDWLEKLLQYAKPGIMLGGKTKNKLKNNSYSEASQLLVSFLYEYFKNTPWYMFTSNNFLVDKASFQSIGGFDESFTTSAGEDRDFCTRWQYEGYQLNYVSEAVINHAHHLTIRSFWKQHLKYGKAAIQYRMNIENLNLSSPPFRISFYIQLLAFTWRSKVNLPKRFKLSFLIFLSQVATFVGFFKAKWSNS